MSKPLLSPDEFIEALAGAIGRNSMYKLLSQGKIRYMNIGNKMLIPASEIQDFPERESGFLGIPGNK